LKYQPPNPLALLAMSFDPNWYFGFGNNISL